MAKIAKTIRQHKAQVKSWAEKQPHEHHRIVCAACRYGPLIVQGVRHLDHLMVEQLPKGYVRAKLEFGFMDNRWQFQNRQQAWVIAERANQLIRIDSYNDTSLGKTLYSENLY